MVVDAPGDVSSHIAAILDRGDGNAPATKVAVVVAD